ncbi:hypothetical protein [Methanimicrococcus blatticola]|uniref:hypothetical protein n=1 Tax=Methanimicrococcus blatticola TaxID=91560 RepID=UPI001414F473|nr:hypothetical protein [Methanimicrococcus blatticola]
MLCAFASALLCASASFYHIRSLARTWHCYLTVCIATAILLFALPLLPYCLHCRCYLTVCIATATLRFALLPPLAVSAAVIRNSTAIGPVFC